MRLSRGGLIEKLLILLVCILPFLYIPSVFNPFEFPKFIVFVCGVFAIGSFFLFVILSGTKNLNGFPQSNILTNLILLYALWVFVCDIFGLDFKISILGSMWRHQGFITLLSGVALYLMLAIIPRKEKQTAFLFFVRFICIAIGGICVISLFHAFSAFILRDNAIPLYNGRIVGTFGNPNFLGGYLAMTLPFVFEKNVQIKFRLLLVPVILLVIIVSGSRAAWIATVVVLAFETIRFTFLLSSFKKVIPFFLFTILILGMWVLYVQKLYIVDRSSVWEGRSMIWKEGVTAFVKNPIMGIGQENFELIFPRSFRLKVDNAHNIFLETAVSSGIVGLFLFIGILVVVFIQASIVVRLSLLAFLIVAQFNPLSISQIALFWFLISSNSGFTSKIDI